MSIEIWEWNEQRNMIKKRRWGVVALALVPALLLAMFLYGNATQNKHEVPIISAGILDLQNWDMNSEPTFRLSGEWRVSPDQLLKSDQLESSSDSTIMQLPVAIKPVDIYDKPLQYSSATYYIHITNAPANKILGLRLGEMTSAYRLYADNQLIAVNGQLTDNALAPISAYPLQTVVIPMEKSDFNLILQTANKYDERGIIQWPLELGLYSELLSQDELQSLTQFLTIGGLLAISLLLLFLTLIVPWKREALVLTMFGIVTLTQLVNSHYFLVARVVPLMPLALFDKIHFLSSYASWLLMLVSLALVFSKQFPSWFTGPILILFTVLLVYVAAIPLSTFHGLNWPDVIPPVICFGSLVFAGQAVLEKEPGAPVILGLLGCLAVMILVSVFTGDSSLIYNLVTSTGLLYGCFILAACIIFSHDYIDARNMELNALKDQIKPHFVHNALASIISISRNDPDRSRDLLIDFSNYLRGGFDSFSTEYISIEQALDFIRSYVTLEKTRLGDRIQVEYQIEAHNFLIPPLLLQPLVENALIHGLRSNQDEITVTVYTQLVNHKSVRVGVRDNGPGLQPGKSHRKERHGIALFNVNRRLARIYGTELKYQTPAGGGCEVYMEIAYKEVPEK